MIYLRRKRTGNYELTNEDNATEKVAKKNFVKWYNKNRCGGRIIKATYRKSQTYFASAEEVLKFVNK